jgi:hypothetical protein
MKILSCLIVVCLLLLLTAPAKAADPVVRVIAEVTEPNVGGCAGYISEPFIVRAAIRAALLRTIEDNPDCEVPVYQRYRILEREDLFGCGWSQSLRIKLEATFGCLSATSHTPRSE